MDIKTKLSTLWIVVMVNMIFADIFSIIIEIVNGNSIDIIGGNVTITMAIAAIVLNIPILMIYFSRCLSYHLNRPLNIVAAFLTIIFIISGGSLTPHYVIIAIVEIVLLLSIIWNAIYWTYKKYEYNN